MTQKEIFHDVFCSHVSSGNELGLYMLKNGYFLAFTCSNFYNYYRLIQLLQSIKISFISELIEQSVWVVHYVCPSDYQQYEIIKLVNEIKFLNKNVN